MDVVFAVMPFADAGRPAMGLGLLAAEVQTAGYSARVLHFNLDLAAAMGLADYQRVASGFLPNMLLGEWFFADDVFGADIPGAEEYLADIFVPVAGEDRALIATLEGARCSRGRFLDACVAEIMSLQPRVVGLATVFHQTCACLALARRLKALPSPPIVVMGGANCEGEMGQQLLESFPWIDAVCSGEADVSFPALLDRLWGRVPDTPIPGVLERGQRLWCATWTRWPIRTSRAISGVSLRRRWQANFRATWCSKPRAAAGGAPSTIAPSAA